MWGECKAIAQVQFRGSAWDFKGNEAWWNRQDQAHTGGMQVDQWWTEGGILPIPPAQHVGKCKDYEGIARRTRSTALHGDMGELRWTTDLTIMLMFSFSWRTHASDVQQLRYWRPNLQATRWLLHTSMSAASFKKAACTFLEARRHPLLNSAQVPHQLY